MKQVSFPVGQFPLSGDVSQYFSLLNNFMSGNQFSVYTINLGRCPDPTVEHEVLQDVASYGRQLGRIGDALEVLMDHFDPKIPLKKSEEKAMFDLRRLLADIADVKGRTEQKNEPLQLR